MATTLYYFTGTGNCLQAARELAAELGGADIVNIARAMDKPLDQSAECAGIIYPVYMFGMPLIVSRFLKKFVSLKGKYIFAVATYGGMPGNSLGQTAAELKLQGQTLAAGFGLRMPGNYTPLYGAISEKKQEKLFLKARKRIKEIAVAVREKRQCRIERNNFFVNLFFSGILYKLGAPRIPDMDSAFWTDMKCTGCGICAKACPVKNVALVDGRPKWLHRCEQCMACLQWCPEQAIQYGADTLKRRRYHHPGVKLEDIINTGSGC